MNSLASRVHSIVATQFGLDLAPFGPDASLHDDLGADSLDVVELVMALEEEFNISVPDEDVENIRTLRDIVSYLHKRESSA